MADLGGVKEAIRTYEKIVERYKNLTSRQRDESKGEKVDKEGENTRTKKVDSENTKPYFDPEIVVRRMAVFPFISDGVSSLHYPA